MIDGRERVTARCPYISSFELPGMLHAAVLRSPVPHARIAAVDVARAERLRGVEVILTGARLAGRAGLFPYVGPVVRDQPILAMEKVRFVGEPVAAVAARDGETALEALQEIELELEELPTVFDAEEALEPEAPLLHEEPPRLGRTFADIVVNVRPGTNVCNHFKLRKGDIARGFDEAAHVFEDTFTSPPIQHVPLETHGCVASVASGRLTVWAGTQTPHFIRAQLAEVFGFPLANVRVVVPTLGGGYGGKCYTKLEPLTAVLAHAARQPVKLELGREEEFVTVTKHGVAVELATGMSDAGKIVARKARCLFNTGAYADIGPRLIKNGGYGVAGPYDIPHVWVDSYAVYTNLPPAGAFRGYGISQAAWAYEGQMDMIAARLGLDPLELRLANVLVDGSTFSTGQEVERARFSELLTCVADGIDYGGPPARPAARKARGKGVGCAIKGSVAPSTSTATVRVNGDGSVNVLTSSVEMGQGLKTAMAVFASEVLGVPLERVEVSGVDTDVTPYDQQTSASRSTYAMGAAVQGASGDALGQVLEEASQLLEVDVADLEAAGGEIRLRGSPAAALSYEDVLRGRRLGNVIGLGRFQVGGGLDPETGQGIASVHWHQGAAAAEVEVDLDTGCVDVTRLRLAAYAGRVVSPTLAELQLEGCAAFGISQALYEEMRFDDGQLQNPNLAEYMISSIKDLPRDLAVDLLEDREPGEIHGLGETCLPPIMPAIANAVFAATGARITSLPITPEKVLRALRG